MTLTALLIVLMAGTEIFRPLRELRGVLHQGMLGQSAATSVHALMDARGTLPPGHDGATPATIEPTIPFDAVGFAYPGGRGPAHQGLDFRIAAGLREADPQSGAVRIGGHDLRTLAPDAVRSRIAVVAQDSALFHGSIAEPADVRRTTCSVVVSGRRNLPPRNC